MLAISSTRLLIAAGSTFSMWASFLGNISTIWFPGQMRQSIVADKNIFEGELDYNDKLPDSVLKLIKL